eukprot:5828876-Lingulodinium_polyedra.AAC.1
MPQAFSQAPCRLRLFQQQEQAGPVGQPARQASRPQPASLSGLPPPIALHRIGTFSHRVGPCSCRPRQRAASRR